MNPRASPMLGQRVLTALILVPLVVWVVLTMPTLYLALGFGAVVSLGAFEWAGLCGLESRPGRLAYAALLGLGLWAGWYVLESPQLLTSVLTIATGWWLITTVRLLRLSGISPLTGFSPSRAAEGLVVLLPPWLSLLALHRVPDNGRELVLFLLILVWVADSTAFFAGRRWGRAKLAPIISPGKTREGLIGALGGAAVSGIVMGVMLQQSSAWLLWFVTLCVGCALISVVGDLFESLVKRARGVKDSGTLLPGHGGVLDRIDSLSAAAPVFVLGLQVLGRTA